jgi:superfamily II DNA or RNA helicase
MQVIDNKALLLNVRNPGRITTVIPKSKDMGDGKVLVHWNLEEAQVLKNLKIKDVPSPILGKYDWPGRYKPFDHQKDTASFLTLHRRAFCLNEQGTGKTGSAIWAADYLMKLGKIKRVLIVCPLSIMDSAWRSDLFNFAMHRTVDIAHGARDKRIKIINGDAEFVIINYDGLNIVEEEVKKGGFDLIIVDEANAYKNAQTTRWKTLNRILTPDTWLWMMTGTPAAQSPVDAYGLAKLVNPKGVPQFFTGFKDMVMTKVSTFKWVVRPNADKVVFEALQPAIRYTKEECLDLPEMTYVVRDVELTPQQKKYYEALRKQLVVQTTGEQITAVNAAVGLNKLLQISCGAVYADSGETLHFDISNRYKVLREVIDETNQKILIFVPFKHTISLLKEKLAADGFSTDVISGEVSAGARADIFRRFQSSSDPRILIIQPQAAAHGVTLTAADTIVWWGPTSSLEIYAQANARAHRAGQRHPVTVVKLQGSNAEKHVYRMLDNRITENGKLIDLYKTLLD